MINQLPNQEDLKKTNPILPDIPYVNEDPIILISYKVDIIEFSEILEPEPLP